MATVRTLDDRDQPALEAFLADKIDSSLFLLANSRDAGLVDRGQRLQGTYFGAVARSRLVGVVALYWNGNLILQAPGRELGALVDAARAVRVRPLRGLIGPDSQVARARRRIDPDPDSVQMDEREGLYALDLAHLAVPEPLSQGRLRGRRAEARDLDEIATRRLAYSLETLNDADTPELRAKCRADMERSIAEGSTWVVEEQDRMVAQSSFNVALAEIVQIGGVYTPPAFRGRGYGRAAVAASLIDARARGVARSVLFTGRGNRPAIKAYESLGYRRIGDYRILLFKPPGIVSAA